jgi:AcrR family transcriptional regulator
MFSVADQEQVGRAVRSARLRAGETLRGTAARLGVSPATLSALERGLTPLSTQRLQRLAALLDVPAARLLAGEETSAAVERRVDAGTDVGEPGDWRDFSRIRTDPVLEAASRVFVRRGFHAATMREVAAEAGLSVAGVYHHHHSKEQLLVTLLDLTMAEIRWRLEAARRQGRDPVESFALMVESLALFHAVRGDLAFLGASEMRAFSAPERLRITALRDEVQHSLDDQARACVEVAGVEHDDVRIATRAIATMCTSLPSWFRPDGPTSATSVARTYSIYALAMLGIASAR